MSERDSPVDDTDEFRRMQLQYVRSLADDVDVQRASQKLTELSDRHNYSYVWRWLGLPIIQMPTDMVVLQEIVWECRPSLVIETGVARGGSMIFLASILELLGMGSVLGIDIDIRPHNREAVEAHPLAHRVELLEGSSTDARVISRVKRIAAEAERVMVILDSNHTHAHVLEELRAYGPLVTAGQFLVVADTMVEDLPVQTHRPRPWGPGDNPRTALDEFLRETDDFFVDEEVNSKLLLTSSPGGYLRRIGT